jgi:hypothetical protein
MAQVSPFKLKELGENFLHMCQFRKNILFTTDLTEYRLTKLHLIFLTLDNDQLNAQIFFFIYYDPLHVHVSSNILLILRGSNCINTASGIVTVSR